MRNIEIEHQSNQRPEIDERFEHGDPGHAAVERQRGQGRQHEGQGDHGAARDQRILLAGRTATLTWKRNYYQG